MVKLAEIAEASGFSIPVVSRVLNPNPKVEAKIAPKTRLLIQETAKRMGYRPNRNAEFLKRGQNPVIGVFLPRYRNSLIADLVMGISETAQKHGFPVSFVFEMNFSSYRKFIDETSGQRNCGIITYPYFKFDREATGLITDFREKGGKLVMIDPDLFLPQFPHVELDDVYGGQLAAGRLLALKCEEYLHMSTLPGRTTGFRGELKKQGIVPAIFAEVDKDYRQIIDICRKSDKRIGIFCSTDRMAVKIHGMLMRQGLIPGDRVKLIGYDDLYLAEHLSPALTTVRQPFFEVGVLAVEKLIDIIYGRITESTVLKPELIIRETA